LTANRLGVSDYGPGGGGPNIMSQRPSPARHAAPPLIQTRMIPRTAPWPSSRHIMTRMSFSDASKGAGPAKATRTAAGVTGPGGGGGTAAGQLVSSLSVGWAPTAWAPMGRP
jgi:hypothetical protein